MIRKNIYRFILVFLTMTGVSGLVFGVSGMYQVQEDLVPIFGYHKIINDSEIPDEKYEITQADFKRQLEFATNELGCRWLTMDDLMDYVENGDKVPTDACVLTFDDGTWYQYEYALPVLDELEIPATFYIIAGRVGTNVAKGQARSYYMTWNELDDLVKRGHTLGSHSYDVTRGILTEGLNYEEVYFQLFESKKILEDRGYSCDTFAYPLGEWDNGVVDILKDVGYVGARDIEKQNFWRTYRTLTISEDDDFIYHMYYKRPEGWSDSQIEDYFGYDGWWQFEEGYAVENDDDSDVRVLSSVEPTENSYAIVELRDAGDKISNKFIVKEEDDFTIQIYGVTSYGDEPAFSRLERYNVYVDGEQSDVYAGDAKDCEQVVGYRFCSFYTDVSLEAGVHELSVESEWLSVRIDKFAIWSDSDQDFYYSSPYETDLGEPSVPEPSEPSEDNLTDPSVPFEPPIEIPDDNESDSDVPVIIIPDTNMSRPDIPVIILEPGVNYEKKLQKLYALRKDWFVERYGEEWYEEHIEDIWSNNIDDELLGSNADEWEKYEDKFDKRSEKIEKRIEKAQEKLADKVFND